MPVSTLQNLQWKDPSTKQFMDALIQVLREQETEINNLKGRARG